MADKSKNYDDFLKSLRVAIANTSVYFNEHPLFIKSVDNLRKNIGELLLLTDSLRMGIAPDSLFFGGEYLKGAKLYEEIAAFFHRRKIKAVSFKQGVHNEELIIFLTSVNLSPKDILRKGGLENILKVSRLGHIAAEDLDYSQLLKSEGEEYSDIWLYLLKKSLVQGDYKKIGELAADFQKVLKRLRVEDLVDNEDITESIRELFIYLKERDKDKFSQCSVALIRAILKSGGQLNESQVAKLKIFLEGLNVEDISNAILGQFQDDEELDSASLVLFSKLIDREKHEGVAAFLAKKLETEAVKGDPRVISGIKELISLPDFSSYGSKVYHDNLASILEGISLGEGLCFDRSQVIANYRFVLLELFALERNSERLKLVLDSILPELDKALGDNDLKYLESFLEILTKKKEKTPEFKSLFPAVSKSISAFAEEVIFRQDQFLGLESLTDLVDVSSVGEKFYLDKIFKENKVNPYVLKLFFKLFPDQLNIFCENLDKKISDAQFVEKIMESLEGVAPAKSIEILKFVFHWANNFVKIKALKKMKELNLEDEEFLFFILEKEDFLQRKQALLLLARSPSSRVRTAKKLLAVSNLLGLKSRIIESNLKLVDEVFFSESADYLRSLTKYRFFWNRNIRRKAREILNKNGI